MPIRFLALTITDCFTFGDNIRFRPSESGWYQFSWAAQANVFFPFNVSIRSRERSGKPQRNFPVFHSAVAATEPGASLLDWNTGSGLVAWTAAGALALVLTVYLDAVEEIAFDIPEAGTATVVGFLGACPHRVQYANAG